MNSLSDKLKIVQVQESGKEELQLAESIKKLLEELQKMGFDKKPEYTIPHADTVGRGYYSAFLKK